MSDNNETAHLTADVVPMTNHEGELRALVIERGYEPDKGRWAFPGGHLNVGEDFPDAARREMEEETGLTVEDVQQIGAYGAPGRDTRGRYVTVAYLALLPDMPEPTAGDDASAASWIPVTDLLNNPDQLAFDHAQILTDATEKIRQTTRSTS